MQLFFHCMYPSTAHTCVTLNKLFVLIYMDFFSKIVSTVQNRVSELMSPSHTTLVMTRIDSATIGQHVTDTLIPSDASSPVIILRP